MADELRLGVADNNFAVARHSLMAAGAVRTFTDDVCLRCRWPWAILASQSYSWKSYVCPECEHAWDVPEIDPRAATKRRVHDDSLRREPRNCSPRLNKPLVHRTTVLSAVRPRPHNMTTPKTCGKCHVGWICEKHPALPWCHPDQSQPDGVCAGPGIPCDSPTFLQLGNPDPAGASRDPQASASPPTEHLFVGARQSLLTSAAGPGRTIVIVWTGAR